jgi:hypothetical protein
MTEVWLPERHERSAVGSFKRLGRYLVQVPEVG